MRSKYLQVKFVEKAANNKQLAHADIFLLRPAVSNNILHKIADLSRIWKLLKDFLMESFHTDKSIFLRWFYSNDSMDDFDTIRMTFTESGGKEQWLNLTRSLMINLLV